MKKAKVIISLLICLSLLCMLSVEVLEAGHDCIGENCEICIFVAFCHDAFHKSVSLVFLLTAVAAGAAAIIKPLNRKREYCDKDSLVLQKVKLTD